MADPRQVQLKKRMLLLRDCKTGQLLDIVEFECFPDEAAETVWDAAGVLQRFFDQVDRRSGA